jgi:hypothetical protein
MRLRRVKSERVTLARKILDGELNPNEMPTEQLCRLGLTQWFVEFLRDGEDTQEYVAERVKSYAQAIIDDTPDAEKLVLSVEFTDEQIETIEAALNHWARWHNCRHIGVHTMASALTEMVEEWASQCEGVDLSEQKETPCG